VGRPGSPKAGSGASLTLIQPEDGPEPPLLPAEPPALGGCRLQWPLPAAAPSLAWPQRSELPGGAGGAWVAGGVLRSGI